MKVEAHIKYPYIATFEDDVVVDVPDEEDVDSWLDEHAKEILELHGAEDIGGGSLNTALDLGYASVRSLKGE